MDECKPLGAGHSGPHLPVHAGGLGAGSDSLRRHVGADGHGKAVQVDPIEPTLKAPGTKRLKLKHDKTAFNVASILLSNSTCAATPWPSCAPTTSRGRPALAPSRHGLTLVHFSAQRKQYLWDTLGTFNRYMGHNSSQPGHKTVRCKKRFRFS